jgi:hypothetical protein
MRKKDILLLVFVMLAGLLLLFVSRSVSSEKLPTGIDIKNLDLSAATKNMQPGTAVKPGIDFFKLPLYFIVNKGQVHEKAKFYAKASRYTLWLTEAGLVFDRITKQDPVEKKQDSLFTNDQWKMTNDQLPMTKYDRDVSRLLFLGANKHPAMVSLEEAKLKVNYFIGNDKSKWHCDVPTSMAVLYKNLYKNIDLKVYGIEQQIEYDWIVKPGGNPADIRFEYRNVKGTRIDDKGNLVIDTEFGELIHQKPVCYQVIDSKKQAVEVSFEKTDRDRYGFSVGNYDKSYELIIDPMVLTYSTYLGGSDSDVARDIVADNNGNAYVTGYTGSADFPTQGELMLFAGWDDAFVTKIDTTQSGAASLVYSTYLGGSRCDYGIGIDSDDSGNVYVTGYTTSVDFPTKNQYMNDPDNSGSHDVFVSKIDTSQSGEDSLVYSTYLGGSSDEVGWDIAADSSGNVYMTGWTASTDFPIKNQYMDGPKDNDSDAFITKIDTTQSGAASLVYSTYLGGSGSDGGYGIAVDNSGYSYITGYTYSADFPTKNGYMTKSGYSDAFVTKLDTTQSGEASLLYSTYLGGSSYDSGHGIAADSSGNVYVTGETSSSDFPTKKAFKSKIDNQDSDVFCTKIDTNKSGEISLVYSTYLGGGSIWECGYGITADNIGNAYIAGYTMSTDFPTKDEYMTDPGDGFYVSDAFVTKIDTSRSGADSLLYSTYIGGSNDDYGRGIAIDNNNNIYVTGYTRSTDFPTKNPYMSDSGGGFSDAFLTKLIHNIFLNLSATRETESAWIISRQYGKLILVVYNPDNIQVVQYIIYRMDQGGNYSPIAEIPGDLIQQDPFLYYDKYLDKDKTYSYKVLAVDAAGQTIGVSNEKTI